ncbi:DUF4129 domain-containing protein [Microbacterium sp. 4R-513]|uniref:DUF4129 domain-containing protein n=1 Tax=Microbacterium sp. 4R-513 TaxID=2567934 RepID=UPI0013E1E8F1|nr:DUF4129 domain-containing protein [Microbacterium sp. 4R-513]QIG38286.1 DUF4129 domain-containing protein [Microbacterium sp. 4R-513]
MTPIIARLADSVPPLTPDGEEARRWAEQELSKPVYAEAEPTLFDRIARAIAEFFERLFSTQLDGPWGSTAAIVAAIIVVLLIVGAFLVWGRPRATHRSRVAVAELFGETETRSAGQLRADAESAAARRDWDAAIVLRFRALARGAVERGAVETPPGATVHGFARRAGRVFPASADALEAAAVAFDDVRYLRRPGTEDLYRRIVAVDETVSRSRPVDLEPLPAGPVR